MDPVQLLALLTWRMMRGCVVRGGAGDRNGAAQAPFLSDMQIAGAFSVPALKQALLQKNALVGGVRFHPPSLPNLQCGAQL